MFLSVMNRLRNSLFVGILLLGMWACSDSERESGDDYFTAGKYEQAIDAYSRELQMKPNNVNLLYSRARAHEELGNYDAAMEDFQTAMKQDDRNVRVLIGMGDVLYKQQNFDNALFYYEQATNFESNNPVALFKEGRAHHKLGNAEEAVEKYDAAIREKSTMGEAYLYRGAIRISQGKNRSACNDFREAQSHNVSGAEEAIAKYCN